MKYFALPKYVLCWRFQIAEDIWRFGLYSPVYWRGKLLKSWMFLCSRKLVSYCYNTWEETACSYPKESAAWINTRGAWGMCGHCFPQMFDASCLLFLGISWANIRWIGNWWWEKMGIKKRGWGSKMDWMDTEGKQEADYVWESPLLLEDIWGCFAQRGEATKDPCHYLFPPDGVDHQHARGRRRCSDLLGSQREHKMKKWGDLHSLGIFKRIWRCGKGESDLELMRYMGQGLCPVNGYESGISEPLHKKHACAFSFGGFCPMMFWHAMGRHLSRGLGNYKFFASRGESKVGTYDKWVLFGRQKERNRGRNLGICQGKLEDMAGDKYIVI